MPGGSFVTWLCSLLFGCWRLADHYVWSSQDHWIPLSEPALHLTGTIFLSWMHVYMILSFSQQKNLSCKNPHTLNFVHQCWYRGLTGGPEVPSAEIRRKYLMKYATNPPYPKLGALLRQADLRPSSVQNLTYTIPLDLPPTCISTLEAAKASFLHS